MYIPGYIVWDMQDISVPNLEVDQFSPIHLSQRTSVSQTGIQCRSGGVTFRSVASDSGTAGIQTGHPPGLCVPVPGVRGYRNPLPALSTGICLHVCNQVHNITSTEYIHFVITAIDISLFFDKSSIKTVKTKLPSSIQFYTNCFRFSILKYSCINRDLKYRVTKATSLFPNLKKVYFPEEVLSTQAETCPEL